MYFECDTCGYMPDLLHDQALLLGLARIALAPGGRTAVIATACPKAGCTGKIVPAR